MIKPGDLFEASFPETEYEGEVFPEYSERHICTEVSELWIYYGEGAGMRADFCKVLLTKEQIEQAIKDSGASGE